MSPNGRRQRSDPIVHQNGVRTHLSGSGCVESRYKRQCTVGANNSVMSRMLCEQQSSNTKGKIVRSLSSCWRTELTQSVRHVSQTMKSKKAAGPCPSRRFSQSLFQLPTCLVSKCSEVGVRMVLFTPLLDGSKDARLCNISWPVQTTIRLQIQAANLPSKEQRSLERVWKVHAERFVRGIVEMPWNTLQLSCRQLDCPRTGWLVDSCCLECGQGWELCRNCYIIEKQMSQFRSPCTGEDFRAGGHALMQFPSFCGVMACEDEWLNDHFALLEQWQQQARPSRSLGQENGPACASP